MLVRWAISCVLLVYAAIQTSQAAGPDGFAEASVSAIQVERSDGAIYLNAQLKFDVPLAIEDVLIKGIPLIFVADAEVRRDRWYWYDKSSSSQPGK